MMDDTDLANYDADDEEFDAINDETFGDIAEYKWEDTNLQTKENLDADESPFLGAHKEVWEDEFDTVEEEMEANVSKLLLDDMDDCETQDDDDKSNVMFYAPPQSLGGASLGWRGEADDHDLVLGSSVWGMGSSSDAKPHPMQSSKPDRQNQIDQVSERPKLRAMNLQELEEEFFKENDSISRKKPTKAIRAEDLERELKEQSNVPRMQMPLGALPVEMGPPFPYDVNAAHAAAAHSAFQMAAAQRFDPMQVRQVLREHGYAQDFNRNGRLFMPDELRNKPYPNVPLLPPYFPSMPPQHRMYAMPMRPEPPSFDGLMTERDKQRIRNIQIIQLQNDHPHKNDYYYQMYLIRTNPLNKELKVRALNKLFPREAEQASKLDYKPVQFDKSLGKIQASSAQAPKRIFDIDNSDKSKVSAASQQLLPGYHRMTLIAIEQGFKRVQALDELIIKAQVMRNVLLDDECEDLYYSRMLVYKMLSEHLPRILNYRKGRVLVIKALPRFEKRQCVPMLATLLRYFDMWKKTMETDTDYGIVLKTLLSVILDLDAKNALALTTILEEKEIVNLLQSRVGLSIFNILAYVYDRHRNTQNERHDIWEKYPTCLDKIDWTIIPCVLTPKYIAEMMKMSINKCKSVQDGRLSFEEWARMENSVYIRKYENPMTLGLFGFERDLAKFWQNTNVLWIDDDLVPQT